MSQAGRSSSSTDDDVTEGATDSAAGGTAEGAAGGAADGSATRAETLSDADRRAEDEATETTLTPAEVADTDGPGDRDDADDTVVTDDGADREDRDGTDDTADPDDELADSEDAAYRTELRKGLLVGLGSGLLVGLVVALVLGAFVWPGYLLGPGSPDDTAGQVVTALGSKDSVALDGIACKGPNGAPTQQLPAQALQLISAANGAGPARQTLDTEARAPVDLVLAAGGQTQTLPSDIVLGVTDGSWCFNGIAERQQ